MALMTAMLILVPLYLHGQSVVKLSGSRAGEAPHRQEWVPPAAVRKPSKTEKTTTQRSEPSDNSSRIIVEQTFHDLGAEFEHRRHILFRGCQGLGSLEKARSNKITKFSGPLSVCLNAKVGTTTFKYLRSHLKYPIPATSHPPVNAIVVRHPLSRLASAYRDKFLNGDPLHVYDAEWQKNIHSGENWKMRFNEYWLLALVSQGFLPETREIFEKTGGPLRRLLPANLTDVMERFMNASFTFNQFLQHVVWTYDHGIVNNHWMTYTRYCDPCRWKFDYILKLETIEEEFDYLLHQVLGYSKTIQLPVRHVSHGYSDRQRYYTNVSRELMERVFDIYKNDFTLFGYEHNLQ